MSRVDSPFGPSYGHRRSSGALAGFIVLWAVLFLHLVLPLDPDGRFLFSANVLVEWAGTVFLLVGPVAAVVLATWDWYRTRRVFLPLLTFSLGAFVSLATAGAMLASFLF